MAQLIKLEDYVSRYQYDIMRYPSQFIRLKKERWAHLKEEWELSQFREQEGPMIEEGKRVEEEQVNISRLFNRLKTYTIRREKKEQQLEQFQEPRVIPLEQVKQSFYKELFQSQLRWASSSLLEESKIHPKYKRDKWLQFFLQQLPDNFFVLYYPVFYFKKATVEGEVLLISPTEMLCISILEGVDSSIFEITSDRFWVEHTSNTKKKHLNPTLSLNRMSSIIQRAVSDEIEFPVKKVILSASSYIDHSRQTGLVEYIDKRNFQTWHEKMKRHPSPIKSTQLRVAKALLEHCDTKGYKRQAIVEEE